MVANAYGRALLKSDVSIKLMGDERKTLDDAVADVVCAEAALRQVWGFSYREFIAD